MEIRRYEKSEIAFNQIETALRLFFGRHDLFAVITLAGAAEELLGELLMARRGEGNVLKPLLDLLRPAQRKKGGGERVAFGETESSIHTDPYQEAVFLLGRAIDDYQALSGTLSQAMQKFNREVRQTAGGP